MIAMKTILSITGGEEVALFLQLILCP